MAYDGTDFVVTQAPVPVRDPKSITDPRERVAYLRDFLRALPAARFDMQQSGSYADARAGECGTASCIGGWARAIFQMPVSLAEVAEALGLSDGQADDLFYPVGDMRNGEGAIFSRDPMNAVAVLDHYLATGKIDWSVA